MNKYTDERTIARIVGMTEKYNKTVTEAIKLSEDIWAILEDYERLKVDAERYNLDIEQIIDGKLLIPLEALETIMNTIECEWIG